MDSPQLGDSIAGPANAYQNDDEFGADIEIDDELESILVQVESQTAVPIPALEVVDIVDIEDSAPRLSPIAQFRKKGWLSVSDLVGTIWCEVQYDYRLRTMPFLPPEQRPQVIKTKEGVSIPVDKAKVEGKERILRRGEQIHKRLEREIHPEEIVVHAVTREDVWGLRFLNMFSALEALLTLGKCRELPVVGFVQGVLVLGVIDEIRREPVNGGTPKRNTRSSVPDKSQTALTSFFSPTKSRPTTARRERTHCLFISDSKTRASGTIPHESDTLAGRLQVMLYKELLDALLLPPRPSDDMGDTPADAALPTERPFSWDHLFEHLDLEMDAQLSESFIAQSRPIISGNGLRFGVREARTLREMVRCWVGYVEALGLGTLDRGKDKGGRRNTGRTEDRLELVYRRAGAKKRVKDSSTPSQVGRKNGPRSGSTRSRRKKRRDAALNVSEDLAIESGKDTAPRMIEAIEKQTFVRDPVEEARSQTMETEEVDAVVQHNVEEIRDDSPGATKRVKGDGLETKTVPDEPEIDYGTVDPDQDAEDAELAWAAEMSLADATGDLEAEENGEVVLRASQVVSDVGAKALCGACSPPVSPSRSTLSTTQASGPSPQTKSILEDNDGGSGSIIGRTVFTHSPRRLATHLASVLQWWLGEREPVGVPIEDAKRCGWCEFEEGCEWRAKKAFEATLRMRASRTQVDY